MKQLTISISYQHHFEQENSSTALREADKPIMHHLSIAKYNFFTLLFLSTYLHYLPRSSFPYLCNTITKTTLFAPHLTPQMTAILIVALSKERYSFNRRLQHSFVN